ncbi:MAG: GFA family protein [Methyloceanibacter sp.]|uniref:GFA family protein n=1 Tax=Methyloceanibacter sp. TaxID=1965321 RepID=UPI003D6D0904
MTETASYSGGCHCGCVRYEVETDLAAVMSCNCSICQKRGALLTFLPTGQFTLLSGEEGLTDYQFNQKIVHHLFCGTCGVGSFARGRAPDGSEMVAVNVRCLDDVDPAALTVRPFDGRSL